MCGISGILSPNPIKSHYIEKSLLSIKHRGPDNTLLFNGINFFSCNFSNNQSKKKFNYPKNIQSENWLGFNRLSIVDLSENAMQPFYDKQNDCCFMLNGEIYNYKELRNKFLPKETFASNSDSEVAFKMYLKFGNDFIKYLQGMFTIVIYYFKKKK